MLWLPPNVWLHGSQSTMTGRSAARNGHACRIICWLADSIRCVFSTPLGAPVEPDVNRILATASGAERAGRGRIAGPGTVASRAASRLAPGRWPVATMSAARGLGRVQRGGEPAGVVGEHGAGLDQLGDGPDPGMVPALQ